MKLPICTFCAKTGMLCANCKAKMETNEINSLDVEISKILVKDQNNKTLQKIKFFNSINTPSLIIIAGNSKLKEAIQKNNQLSNNIKKILTKPFQVVSKEGTIKNTLTSLFSPVEVSSIDEIFVPDGTKEIRINLRGKHEDLPLREGDMLLIASKLTDSHIRIEFVN